MDELMDQQTDIHVDLPLSSTGHRAFVAAAQKEKQSKRGRVTVSGRRSSEGVESKEQKNGYETECGCREKLGMEFIGWNNANEEK